MSWTIKIKHTRPNTGVDWYRVESDSYMSDSDSSHVESTYRDTEKLASASVSLAVEAEPLPSVLRLCAIKCGSFV